MRGVTEPASTSFDEAEFRRVLGHLPTGVTVVTARTDSGEPRGLTANAVTSVSLDPPLILVCVETTSDTHDSIERAAAFAVSILPHTAESLARRFATYEADEKFDGVAHHREATGAPVLDAACCWLDCRVWATYPGGDHTIFVGEVVAADAEDEPPLVYYRGGYGRLAP